MAPGESPPPAISQIVEDAKGNLWVGTFEGLFSPSVPVDK